MSPIPSSSLRTWNKAAKRAPSSVRNDSENIEDYLRKFEIVDRSCYKNVKFPYGLKKYSESYLDNIVFSKDHAVKLWLEENVGSYRKEWIFLKRPKDPNSYQTISAKPYLGFKRKEDRLLFQMTWM